MYPIHLKFVVYGVSGAGKSTLIQQVRSIDPKISVHRKDTTRPPRKTEDPEGTLDLRFISREDFEAHRGDYDVVYSYGPGGHLYGVRRDQLIDAFAKKEVHFVIIRDIRAIQQFKYMYTDAKAIYVHVDPRDIPQHLQQQEGIDLEERLRRVSLEFKEFIENNVLFDHVVLNFWDQKNAVRQMENILHHYIRRATGNL